RPPRARASPRVGPPPFWSPWHVSPRPDPQALLSRRAPGAPTRVSVHSRRNTQGGGRQRRTLHPLAQHPGPVAANLPGVDSCFSRFSMVALPLTPSFVTPLECAAGVNEADLRSRRVMQDDAIPLDSDGARALGPISPFERIG